MKNMHSSSPGFVLTSLSFAQADNKAPKHKKRKLSATAHSSSIIKFDYCLPPDEFNNFELQDREYSS